MVTGLVRLGEATAYGWRAVSAALAAALRPPWWLGLLYQVLLGALPLAVVCGVSLGAVMWMHLHSAMVRVGTTEYLPTLLAAAVLLELSPIAAGLILSARTGASLGAELAAMRATEQWDALELLGFSPMRRLIGPRVWACVLAAPLLHILITTAALASGYAAENVFAPTTWLNYQTAVLRELTLEEVLAAGLKTPIFGLLVGVLGCGAGVQAQASSEGVGQAATQAVVVCSLAVLAADVFLVAIIRSLL